MIQYDSGSCQPNRSYEEIVFAILTVVDGNYNDNGSKRKGATKMKIMADAFVTHECATGYLEKLEHEGLIDYNSGTGVYAITDKGRQRVIKQEK